MMLDKHYDDDWAKYKSRELVKEVVQKNVLTYKKPKDIKVLCFPGIDAAEVIQVYDALGIPRGNIVGLERERAVYSPLESKKLGIDLKRSRLEDFVFGLKEHEFDVVSLDFSGPLSRPYLLAIEMLCDKQKRNHFVLHCANLLCRDGNSHNIYRLGSCINSVDQQSRFESFINNPLSSTDNPIVQASTKMLNFKAKEDNGESIADEKLVAHSRMIRNACGGINRNEIERIFKFVAGDMWRAEYEAIEKQFQRSHPDYKADSDNFIYSLGDSSIVFLILFRGAAKYVERALNKPHIRDLSYQTMDILENLFCERKSFIPKELAQYSYISESGKPMVGEVQFLGYPRYASERAREAGRLLGFPNKFEIRDPMVFREAVYQYTIARVKFLPLSKAREIIDCNRVFLGNASKPVLTKKRFLQEIQSGRNMQEICCIYRGWQNKNLEGWQNELGQCGVDAESIAEESPENGYIEKLTKEQAIDLISSGIPTDEIVKAWPNSFSIGQLRAFKSHITKGTYPLGIRE